MPKVRVFIDYRNMYHRAHDAFFIHEPNYFGNFMPLALGRLLTEDQDRDLAAVHVYCGVPAQKRDKKGYEIMQRRTSAWERDDPEFVKLHLRTLRYPPNDGREKGVDVALAIDFVALAIDGEYDVGVLCSADTDLIPALELVRDRFPAISLETVGWTQSPGMEAPEPLDIQGGGIHRRVIDAATFRRVADKTNYVTPRTENAQPPGAYGRRRRRRPNGS